jgi:hypothetical protein
MPLARRLEGTKGKNGRHGRNGTKGTNGMNGTSGFLQYSIHGDTIYFLGVVHERGHPDWLKERLGSND